MSRNPANLIDLAISKGALTKWQGFWYRFWCKHRRPGLQKKYFVFCVTYCTICGKKFR